VSPVLDHVYTTGLVRVNTDTPLHDRYPKPAVTGLVRFNTDTPSEDRYPQEAVTAIVIGAPVCAQIKPVLLPETSCIVSYFQ